MIIKRVRKLYRSFDCAALAQDDRFKERLFSSAALAQHDRFKERFIDATGTQCRIPVITPTLFHTTQ